VKITHEVTLDPDALGKDLKSLPDKERIAFALDFVAALDTDSYHHICKFCIENPTDAFRCPRCRCMTFRSSIADKTHMCEYCRAVLP
jgi:hypothetical protein